MTTSAIRESVAGLSPEALAALADSLTQEIHVAADVIPPQHADVAPMSFAQLGLWLTHQHDPDSSADNIYDPVMITGAFAVALLQQTLREVVRRHAVLRTTFEQSEPEPRQRIGADSNPRLRLVDLTALRPADADAQTVALASREARHPFRLQTDPPIRATVVRVSPDRHARFCTRHHIASDGWSTRRFGREMRALAAAFRRGTPSRLPELPIAYADYAIWQRRRFTGDWLEREIAWWRQRLEAAEILDLPLDRPRPAVRSLASDHWPFDLPEWIGPAVAALSQQLGATVFMTLLASFQLLLALYCQTKRVTVGTTVAGRTTPELEPLIGIFANLLVMRTDVAQTETFAELVGRVRALALDAYAHQELPFPILVERLAPARGVSHFPFFQVVFLVDEGAEGPHVSASTTRTAGAAVSEVRVHDRTGKADLMLTITRRGDRLEGVLEYTSDVFDRATVVRIARHWVELLGWVLQHPHEPVADVRMLTQEERRLLLETANPVPQPVALEDASLPACLERQVRSTPDRIAVVAEAAHISYGVFGRRVRSAAATLRTAGVGPETTVGVCAERSVELVLGIWAILAAGGAYVPLEPDLPDERLVSMCRDARLRAIVAQRALAARVQPLAPTYVLEDLGTGDRLPADRRGLVSLPVAGTQIAYVLYTSGSTGRPKGAMNTHEGIANHLAWMQRTYRLDGTDRVLHKTSLTFDVSIWELCWPLMAGASIVMARPGAHRDTEAMVHAIRAEQITAVPFVPSILRLIAQETDPAYLRTLRFVIAAGEALDRALVEQWGSRNDAWIVNLYGPTEASLAVAAARCDAGEAEIPPIGRPISNTTIHLLDARRELVPVGVPGELYIGGMAVGRGYARRPDLTADRFEPDPLGCPGARRYRTGDRCRRRADGVIEYLGRLDSQVKLRGLRIELGEIEAVLQQHPAVAAAVVTVAGAGSDAARLVCHWVPRATAARDEGALTAYLQQHLPAYMVPSVWVLLEELPRTTSGKIDRGRLPAPDERRPAPRTSPRTALEQTLARIWAEVLRVDDVAPDDHFFERGGHSLAAVRLVSAIRTRLGLQVPVRNVFIHPTLAAFAASLPDTAAAEAATPLGPVSRDLPLPATFAQQGFWLAHHLETSGSAYNLTVTARAGRAAPLGATVQAWASTMLRHEVFRTAFDEENGVLMQSIARAVPFHVRIVDLSGVVGLTAAIRRADALRPFHLSRAPLCRLMLVKAGPQDYLAVSTAHHITGDEWSFALVNRERQTLERAYGAGTPGALAPLMLQYADYGEWQRRQLTDLAIASHLKYWRTTLDGAPETIDLPFDRPRSAARRPAAVGRVAVQLPAPVGVRLRQLALECGTTVFTTALAVFHVLLARESRQTVVMAGAAVSGRSRPELEAVAGPMVNTVLVRGDIEHGGTFERLVRQLRDRMLDIEVHKDLPFERVVHEVFPSRRRSVAPIPQVFFTLYPAEGGRVDGSGPHGFADAPLPARFDLLAELAESDGGISGRFEFDTNLFDAATMAGIADRYCWLADYLSRHPYEDPWRVPLTSPAESQRLAALWRGPVQALDDRIDLLPGRITRQVAALPDAIAVVGAAGEHLTYRALDGRANRLALLLRRRGVGLASRVALALDRTIDLIVAWLAVGRTGAAYVPIDQRWPTERRRFVLRDSESRVLICGRDDVLAGEVPTVTTEPETWLPTMSAVPRERITDAGAPFAVIYTSGSTGTPKGVVVTHGGSAHSTTWMQGEYRLRRSDRFLWNTSLTFDPSIWELGWSLATGATIVVAPGAVADDPAALMARVREEQVSALYAVPSLFAILAERATRHTTASLRFVITGGEPLRTSIAERWLASTGVELHHSYGPTETSIAASEWTCVRGWRRHVAAIGRPVGNAVLHLVDPISGDPAPEGTIARLQIGGDIVGGGYYGQPGLTAQRFLPDGFASVAGRRCYDSGDLVRALPEDVLEFVGRDDGQIKLRGMRIELAEVEAAARACDGVAEAVVALVHAGTDAAALACYWVPRADDGPTDAGLQAALRQRLPAHMVPSVFAALTALPLMANGKVDRRRLADLRPQPPTKTVSEPVAGPIEQMLADLWREVLALDAVGRHDNFFERGGHSLAAVRLMARLEQRVGRPIPVATLFAAPTIATLAQTIQAGPPRLPWSPLVEIQRGSSLPPLFCVHPIGGQVLCYTHLAAALGPERPVYGLQAPELKDVGPHAPSIEQIAAHYVDAMLAGAANGGPIHLAGWSFGGTVAFEMARQLRSRGRTVGLLAILDTVAPKRQRQLVAALQDERRLIVELAREEAQLREVPPPFTYHELRDLPPEQLAEFVQGRLRASNIVGDAVDPDVWFANVERHLHGFKSRSRVLVVYDPPPSDGAIVLVRARDLEPGWVEFAKDHGTSFEEEALGWNEISLEPVRVHFVAGSHRGLCLPPAVAGVAAVLSSHLAAVERVT